MAPMHDELEEISLEKSMSYVGSNSRVRKEYEALKAENKRLEAREAVHVKALEAIEDCSSSPDCMCQNACSCDARYAENIAREALSDGEGN